MNILNLIKTRIKIKNKKENMHRDGAVAIQKNWYHMSDSELAAFFHVTDAGLNNTQVLEQRERYGTNVIKEGRPSSLLALFLRQFKSPLVYILLFVIAITIGIGEYVDTLIVASVCMLNVGIGMFQEGRAQNTFFALKKMNQFRVVVMREGKQHLMVSEELVPGDVVMLRPGDRIAADMRIIDNQITIDEAILTGESLPVVKENKVLADSNANASANDSSNTLNISDQVNMLWAGTSVVAGSARAIVVATGADTELGKLSHMVDTLDVEMPLRKSIRRLAKFISIALSIAVAVLFLIGIISGVPIHTMVRIAISLMVAVIPEGLPVILTLVLAVGAERMSQKQILVKRLEAVETLGQATVIAVDKTGTLTRNELVVTEFVTHSGAFFMSGVGYHPEGSITARDADKSSSEIKNIPNTVKQLAYFAEISANASLLKNEQENRYDIVGDPTEAALRTFGKKLGFDQNELRTRSPLIYDIPFDYKKKYYVSYFKKSDTELFAVQTGAAEVVLATATKILTDTGSIDLTEQMRQQYRDLIHERSGSGLRVIGLCYKEISSLDNFKDEIPTDMIFVGLLNMKDALRSEVPEALGQAHKAGIRVVMITGDHMQTATAIATEAGIYSRGDLALSGNEIDAMSVAELARCIIKVTVFGRMAPEHKMKIIQAYQLRDCVVAMTGDGVNDVPSLVAAHLGVAMGKIGTDSAKESADIILLDDNFGRIPEAIAEGRHMYESIKKVLVYLFSTNLAEFIIIIFAVILLLPLPLNPTQIIWLNLVTDTFLVVALALEPKERELLYRARVRAGQLLARDDLWRMVIMSLTMTLGTLVVFSQYLSIGYVQATSMALLTLTFFQWFNIWNVRSRASIMTNLATFFKNRLLVGSSICVFVLQIIILYTPFMQRIFDTTALSLRDWLIALLVGFSVIIVDEIRKKFMDLSGYRKDKLIKVQANN